MKKIRISPKILIFMLICIIIATLCLVTNNVREDMADDKIPLPFDKNSSEEGAYASVEIDCIAPAVITNHQGDRITYYLYGNSETGQYGIASVDYLYEETLFDENETAILYGTVTEMPNLILNELTIEPDENGFSPVYPGQDFKSYAETAFEVLAENGIEIGYDSDFGDKYLIASLTPEKESTFIYDAINVISIVALAGFIFPLIVIAILLCLGLAVFEKGKKSK